MTNSAGKKSLKINDNAEFSSPKARESSPLLSQIPNRYDDIGEFEDSDVEDGLSSRFEANGTPNNKSSQPEKPKNKLLLAGLLVAAIIIAIANNLTWKRTLNRFASHGGHSLEFFVSQFTVLLFIFFSGLSLLYTIYFTDSITPEQWKFPKIKFFYMALLDGSASLLAAIGGAHTAGTLQTLIIQSGIPVTMAMSYFFLKQRYVPRQYLGALLIMCGAAVGIIPTLLHRSTTAVISATASYGVFIYMGAILPGAYSNVYKETNLKAERLDVYLLSTGVAVLQLFVGFMFMPVLAFPAFGGVALSDIPTQLVDGWRCFMGEELEGFQCHTVSPSPMAMTLTFTVVNFVYNVLLLNITKVGGAVMVVITSALALPITNIAFTLPFLMGAEAEPFNWWNVGGLALVVSGFLTYSLVSGKDQATMPIKTALGVGGQHLFIEDRSNIRRTMSVPASYSPGGFKARTPMKKGFKSSPNLSRMANAKSRTWD